ncbi:hypothetical protein AB0J86_36895, partial [Micromonospora sp. NPDC049559]|uniref:hypothetical protein n=1 Tax=Micromonospora sp. NPDC049559 TaxID=3155923 RepID=UPI0034419427
WASLAGGGPGAAYAAPAPADRTGAPTCSLSASGDPADEWASCLGVSAGLDRTPSLGETATLTVTVRADTALPDTDIRIELPRQLAWARVPAGMETSRATAVEPERAGTISVARLTRSLAAGAEQTFTGEVRAVAAGPAQIEARASAVGVGRSYAGKDIVLLTVGEAGRASRAGLAAASGPAGVAPVPTTARADRPAGLTPRSVEPARPFAAQAPCDTRVTGNFSYADQTGAWHNAMNLTVEVWDDDAAGDQKLASGVTDANGNYNLCFDAQSEAAPETGTADVYVKFLSWNTLWRILRAGAPLSFQSGVSTDVTPGATIDMGSSTSNDATLQRGLHAFDVANTAWLWVPKPTNSCFDQKDTTCRSLVVNWAPDSTDGNYYSGATNDVHLDADAPNSPTTVLHEIGHALMDDIYQDDFPPITNCSPHYVDKASSAGCAWVEGWAEWFPATVLNDPFYRWPSGSFIDLENSTWGTANWNNGDTVEGRVAAALIDITDSTNEGTWDRYGEGFANLWYTSNHHVSDTLAQFWAHRAADGFDVADTGALAPLYQSTVDYQFRDPIPTATPLLRPTPMTTHNYQYQTTSGYWSVVGIRPSGGSDLELYDDRAQQTLLGTSAVASGVDFVGVDSKYRAAGDYYPRVKQTSGTGWYRIELAQGNVALPSGTSTIAMTSENVVAVRDVTLTAGQKITVKIAGSATQNPELYLIGSDPATASTWIRSRAQAVAVANTATTGAAETLTYTATKAGHFGLVVVNWAGSGTYTLTRS